jgi:hypothetical protein
LNHRKRYAGEMVTRVVISFVVVILLSGCGSNSVSGGSSKTSAAESTKPSTTETLSFKESCREATRLIGRTTDVTISYGSSEGGSSLADLSGISISFGELAQKTEEGTLKTAILSLQESTQKMSNEDTYFEGSTVYLAEIVPLLTACAG